MTEEVDQLIESTNHPPEPICPCCGHILFPSRQRLVCSNAECNYQETCCEGNLPDLRCNKSRTKK